MNIEDYFLPQLVASAVVILLLPLSKYVAKKLVRKYGTVRQKSELRMRQVRHVIGIVLNVTLLLALAIIWGVQPQNILIGLSSVFAVMGVAFFAQWSVLSNITAGIIMFFSAPFKAGDSIRIIDKDTPIEAVIEIIGTFYTHIRTAAGELIVLPNSLFLQKIVSVKE